MAGQKTENEKLRNELSIGVPEISTVLENPEGHTHIHRFTMPRRDLIRFNLLPQVDNEQEVKAMAQLLPAEALKLCFKRHRVSWKIFKELLFQCI